MWMVAEALFDGADSDSPRYREIRRTPGCHNVQEVAINRVTEGVDFNWSTCVLSSGSADANTAARAAIHVQSVLRQDYDLLND